MRFLWFATALVILAILVMVGYMLFTDVWLHWWLAVPCGVATVTVVRLLRLARDNNQVNQHGPPRSDADQHRHDEEAADRPGPARVRPGDGCL